MLLGSAPWVRVWLFSGIGTSIFRCNSATYFGSCSAFAKKGRKSRGCKPGGRRRCPLDRSKFPRQDRSSSELWKNCTTPPMICAREQAPRGFAGRRAALDRSYYRDPPWQRRNGASLAQAVSRRPGRGVTRRATPGCAVYHCELFPTVKALVTAASRGACLHQRACCRIST
jgi:hypothetical protein